MWKWWKSVLEKIFKNRGKGRGRGRKKPTQPPTEAPTKAPTQPPTEAPTKAPTQPPTEAPKAPKADYVCSWAFLRDSYYDSLEKKTIDPITQWTDTYLDAFRAGLQRIEDESNGRIKFTEESNIALAHIRVGQHLMDSESVIAHAYFPFARRDGLAQDVHFDSRDIGMSATMFREVTTHEVLHSLGMEHSSDSRSILYPRYMGIGQIFTEDDKQRLDAAIDALIASYS